MDRASNITYTAFDGSLISSLEDAYDAFSMITNKAIISTLGALSNDQYRYDSLNDLVSEEKSNSVSFAYSVVYHCDLAGNRTWIMDNATTNTYAPAPATASPRPHWAGESLRYGKNTNAPPSGGTCYRRQG